MLRWWLYLHIVSASIRLPSLLLPFLLQALPNPETLLLPADLPSPTLWFSAYVFNTSWYTCHQPGPGKGRDQWSSPATPAACPVRPGTTHQSIGPEQKAPTAHPPGLNSRVPSTPLPFPEHQGPLLSAWEKSCPARPSSQGLYTAAALDACSTSAPTPPPWGLALCQAPADFNTSLFN